MSTFSRDRSSHAMSRACLVLGAAVLLPTAALAATRTVTTTADSGTGSLRSAISQAVAGDTIVFDAALQGKTISLASALTISKSLTINPAPSIPVTISGQGKVRVLSVSGSKTAVRLSGVTIANGYIANQPGGGISNAGVLTLTGVVVTGNRIAGALLPLLGMGGAGVYNSGTLTVQFSTITGNSDAANSAGGAGIFNVGTLTVDTSEISKNAARSTKLYGQYGGGGLCNRGRATLTASTVTGNTATGFTYGGGAGIYNSGTLALSTTIVSGNVATGIHGGGIVNWQNGVLTLSQSTVANNHADGIGGGIANAEGQLTVTASTLSGNSASDPNYGGGALYNDAGNVTLVNSTVSGNTALNFGGGLVNDAGNLSLSYTTVAANGAPTGGGLYVVAGSTTVVTDSIIASSTLGQDCVVGDTVSMTQANTLIQTSATCPLAVSGDPMLGPLATLAGSPTQTHALKPGSPAIDRISNGSDGCGGTVANDQNGTPRPSPANGSCDLGAVEFVPTSG